MVKQSNTRRHIRKLLVPRDPFWFPVHKIVYLLLLGVISFLFSFTLHWNNILDGASYAGSNLWLSQGYHAESGSRHFSKSAVFNSSFTFSLFHKISSEDKAQMASARLPGFISISTNPVVFKDQSIFAVWCIESNETCNDRRYFNILKDLRSLLFFRLFGSIIK